MVKLPFSMLQWGKGQAFMHAVSRTASFLRAATFVAGLALAFPGAAHAADKKQAVSYDTAISNCFGIMVLTDPEVRTKMYDGEGFDWTNNRDDRISGCMKKYGYQLQGSQSSRVGTGSIGGRDIAPQIIRNKFRREMTRYGGAESLAKIDAGQDTTFIPDAILQQAQGKVKVPAGASNSNTSGASPAQMKPAVPIPPAQTSVTQIPLPAPAPAPTPDYSNKPAPPAVEEMAVPKPAAPKAPRPVVPAPTGGGKPVFLPH
jgi:hypothetical protein